MIPNVPSKDDTNPWKNALKHASLSLADLLDFVALTPADFTIPLLTNPAFKIKVTQHYLQKIQKKNPLDPLLLQILPFEKENQLSSYYAPDPVGDLVASPAPGLVKKYHGRALLLTTSVCPIHCRYCFRKHFPYSEHRHLDQAITHLAEDTSITEIILSGGDPLSLDNKKLAALFIRLEAVPHLKTLRIHTRFLSSLPERFDTGLIHLLTHTRFKVVLVSHVNHAQEIDQALIDICKTLPVTLLNQSVFLKEINDSATSQIDLAHALFKAGILPYYLHLLDKAQGTAHFEVPLVSAKKIMQSMQAQLPGYLVPRLVQEIAGEPNKILQG